MSMTFNAVGIIVKYKTGKGADYVLEMGDENSLDLRTYQTLFDGVSTTEELIARFNDGFSDPWDEGGDFNTNVEDWDEGAYKKFISSLRKKAISGISYVCLFTDKAFDFNDRKYAWAKFEFNGNGNSPKFSTAIDIMKEPPYYDSYDAGLKHVKELIEG